MAGDDGAGRQSRQVVRALSAAGLQAGDLVPVVGTSHRALEAALGVVDAGGVAVLSSDLLSPAVEGLRPERARLAFFDWAPATLAPGPGMVWVELLGNGTREGFRPWADFLGGAAEGAAPAAPAPADPPAVVAFTGSSRTAIALSRKNLEWTGERLARALSLSSGDSLRLEGAVSPVTRLAFAFAARASGANLLSGEGEPTVLLGDPETFQRLAAEVALREAAERPSRRRVFAWALHLAAERTRLEFEGRAVPVTVQAGLKAAIPLVVNPLRAALKLERVRLACCAGPVPERAFAALAGAAIPLLEVYGQPETSGVTSLSAPGQGRRGKAGRPLLGVEVRVGEGGEFLVRGGNVCAGCFGDAQATARLFEPDGWLHTGDTGELDEEGFLRLIGKARRD